MKYLHIVTGRCGPQTQAEARLELADIAEEQGKYREALEYRAVVARWRRDWREKGPATKGGDPNALVPDHGAMYWHDPEEFGVVCPCGHFTTHLCDEPVGRGMTCDLPLCKCCRSEPREGFDLCSVHAHRERSATSSAAYSEPDAPLIARFVRESGGDDRIRTDE